MYSRDGAVVPQPVVPAHDAEAEHVPLVVQNLQPLGARGRREARHHVHLAERADFARVPADDVAALEELLVGLGVVEAAHYGPHGGDGGVDGLHHRGAALVRQRHRGVRVVAGNRVGYGRNGNRGA